MPIQDRDLGKYKRPGIFINEIDNSIIELSVQDVLINLVPGFSRKGPVNRPVYITNKSDFVNIFGDIDRQLERKGSYFHRTCMKMLDNGPIWALNLLSTNDARDRVNWKSISVGAYYDNNVIKEMPYSRLFNRQDFWSRDDESFLDYVNADAEDTDRLLHLTNLGDKTLTVFMFKSRITGFDITAEDWYGGNTKVPVYIHPKDWISDYMVNVLILEGDWTNYNTLSSDSVWSSYFDSTGLKKGMVQQFVNQPNVITLANYDVSLIPYFRDLNGRGMYIKNVINNATDKTGLFTTFNEDYLLGSDFPTGKVDIIGDGVVGVEKDYIDFLSYNEIISENLTYTQKTLDSAGNTFGSYSEVTAQYASCFNRSAIWTEGYIDGVGVDSTAQTFVEIYAVQNNYICLPTQNGSYWDSHNHTPLLNNDAIFFNQSWGNIVANKVYYIYSKNSNGSSTNSGTQYKISETLGGSAMSLTAIAPNSNGTGIYVQRAVLKSTFTPTSYFILGGTKYTFDTGTTNIVFDPLDISQPGVLGYNYNRYDVLYLSKGNLAEVNILKGVQNATQTATKPQFTLSLDNNIILGYMYLQYNSISTGNTNLTGSTIKMTYTPVNLGFGSNGYVGFTSLSCSGDTIGTTNYFDINFVGTSGGTDYTNYVQLRYRNTYDNMSTQLANGQGVLINSTNGDKLEIPIVTTIDYSTQSDAKIRIPLTTGLHTSYHTGSTGNNFLLYYVDDEFCIQEGAWITTRLYTTTKDVVNLQFLGQTTETAAGVIGKYSALYNDYRDGVINNWDYIYVYNQTGDTAKIYLKMWFEDSLLFIDMMDADKISPSSSLKNWAINSPKYNSHFIVHSAESNYKQTIEIESFDTTKYPDKVYEIKVDKLRYSELIKGSFVAAYYNPADYETGGSKFGQDPRKMCRIVSVTLDPVNSDWKVIKTDSPIIIDSYTSITKTTPDYQTMAYPQIDAYVLTYKGIKLKPFVIHTDSIPNGKEDRQSSILDVMSITTNLGKGLINKNKISWRYLVDSFGLGLTARSKQQYADLCGAKLNCLGFINMPSVKQLKKSTNPFFINSNDLTLDTALLKSGGDETKTPSFLYSFCEGVGRSTVAYFFPYVTVDDNGIPLDFPPSSYVASTYMAKHNTSQGGIYPWTIAAGITNGRVTAIAATEMDFSETDLENLNQMGANAIVKKSNAGFCIDAENTAQVFPYSSLSLIHSREVLIELENRMYDVLLRYQWRFNTAEIRAEIKFRADKICQNMKNSNALYDYRNIMDETNNTNFIIDLQMGVIDTYVEIIKGMGIIVNNITILRKGDIESGGFK